MVVLDALEEQIACLLEEGVDGQVERVVVGVEGRLRGVLVLEQRREVGREGELLLGCLCGQLVEKRSEEVRVADGDGELDKDVRVPEPALLEAALVSCVDLPSSAFYSYLSVVNLPSLYAVIKAGDSLYARRFMAPSELLLTS